MVGEPGGNSDLVVGAGAIATIENPIYLGAGGIDSGIIEIFGNVPDGYGFIEFNGGTLRALQDDSELILFSDFTLHEGTFAGIVFNLPDAAGTFDYATGTLEITAIPESSTLALAASAALLLCAARRRNLLH